MQINTLVAWPTALLVASSLLTAPAAAQEVKAAQDAITQADQKTPTTEDSAMKTIEEFIAEQAIDTSKSGWKTRLPKPPKAKFEDGMKYFWNIETNKGAIKVRLMPEVAPMHVSSTIYLTELGFYDNMAFHRVIPEFMAQGGCPMGNGRGNPGYSYSGEYSPDVKHDRGGLLSMANAGPGTDGSQFFLTFKETPWLNGKHTIFGEVVEGKETLKTLEMAGTAPQGTPKEPLSMTKCTISVEAGSVE